jgi:hypothetical protein
MSRRARRLGSPRITRHIRSASAQCGASALINLNKHAEPLRRDPTLPIPGWFRSIRRATMFPAGTQLAMSLVLASTNAYAIQGDVMVGYSQFPMNEAGAPLARALVMTTPNRPYAGTPSLTPLFLMEKKRVGAVYCNQADPFCHGDYLLVSPEAQVQNAANRLQACRPPRLCLQHLLAGPDVSPVGDRAAAFEVQHRHRRLRGVSGKGFGWLHRGRLPVGVPGHERHGAGLCLCGSKFGHGSVAGRHGIRHRVVALVGDSDGDTLLDSNEISMTGIPSSDPCDGPVMRCYRSIDTVFQDGFE